MVNREEQFIHGFASGTAGPQNVFDNCIEAALLYKYQNGSGIIGPIDNIDITNAIFELSNKDKINLYSQKINGQKLKEIFIVSIYLQYLDKANPDKSIVLSLPRTETSYDVAVFLVEKDTLMTLDNRKIRFRPGKSGTAFLIQVKEEYDFNETRQEPDESKKIDYEPLKEKAAKYEELVLAFNRRYGLFCSDDFNKTFRDNKKVALIISPSEKEMEYTDKQGKKTLIKFEKEKYHFLLASSGVCYPIKFNIPKFLIKTPIFGNGMNQNNLSIFQ